MDDFHKVIKSLNEKQENAKISLLVGKFRKLEQQNKNNEE